MKEWLGTIARLVVGAVWVVAALAKLPHPTQSVLAVRAYQILPGTTATTVGHLLPVVEITIGLMLVLGVLTRTAALASILLFVVFILGISSVWARGIEIDCGCFGGGGVKPGAQSAYPREIARDAGLLLLSAYLVWLRSTRLALNGVLFRRTDYSALHDQLTADLEDDDDADDVGDDLAQVETREVT